MCPLKQTDSKNSSKEVSSVAGSDSSGTDMISAETGEQVHTGKEVFSEETQGQLQR